MKQRAERRSSGRGISPSGNQQHRGRRQRIIGLALKAEKLFMNTFEQLDLFDFGSKLQQLSELRSTFVRFKHSRNTQKCYRNACSLFERWCSQTSRDALPADPETVSLWVVSMVDRGLAVTTALTRLSGVISAHREAGHLVDCYDDARIVLAGAQRVYQHRPKPKAALTVQQLRKISKLLAEDRDPVSVRDRAVLVFGFASALRRSELVSLDLVDVTFCRAGLVVHLQRSKTDQEGKGRDFGIFAGKRPATCPIRALKDWLRARGSSAGPLFFGTDSQRRLISERMRAPMVARVVKRGVERIGLNPAAYGAHSLRAGCVTAAVEAGASELAIMQRTGHRTISTVLRYVRPASMFSMNPLARAL